MLLPQKVRWLATGAQYSYRAASSEQQGEAVKQSEGVQLHTRIHIHIVTYTYMYCMTCKVESICEPEREEDRLGFCSTRATLAVMSAIKKKQKG